MSYRPDEAVLMAYLYDELQADEREKVAEYLAAHPEVRKQLEELGFVRQVMGAVEEQEVIAPPIVIDYHKQRFFSHAWVKVTISIAASLLLLVLAGKMTGLQVEYGNQELRIGFGTPVKQEQPVVEPVATNTLTEADVQRMIRESMDANNQAVRSELARNEKSIRNSLRDVMSARDGKLDQLVQQVSTASESQIRQYALAMQAENSQLMKDYMQLTANEQKQYIEDLLVDFSKYLQQQRTNDLMTLQTRLNTIEQNTDLFKQETEQILTSLISTVDKPVTPQTTKY